MRRLHLSLILLIFVPIVAAQTPRQFTVKFSGTNEVPPSASPSTGFGLLSLYGNTLWYYVGVERDLDWFAFIHGPAGPGTNGPLIADFPHRGCSTPRAPYIGACGWLGELVLTDDQVTALTNGLLYIRIAPYIPEFAAKSFPIRIGTLSPTPRIAVPIHLCAIHGIGLLRIVRVGMCPTSTRADASSTSYPRCAPAKIQETTGNT